MLLKNGGNDTSTETAWSFRDNLEFYLFICEIINEILYIKSKSGKIIIQKYFANTYWNDMFTYIKIDEE